MSQVFDSARTQRIRAEIEAFLQERLGAKLDKLPDGDSKRDELIAQFQRETWLEDAARRVQQIQAVTHALKPIHPDARGTNLYVDPTQLPMHDAVGSHTLGSDFSSDVVGNAAALDVYKFLKLGVDGHSILEGLLADDPSTIRALSDDSRKAEEWRAAFVTLVHGRDTALASHVLAKQLYWLVGSDATDDGQYHLLAPLFPTSLAHAIHAVLQEDRFGDVNKAARDARRAGKEHDGVVHDYPALAVRKLGGTKPQNVSQLNSERGGVNYLLGSLPPVWQSSTLPKPWRVKSIFDHMLIRREGVRPTVRALLGFLKNNPPANVDTRNRVDAYVGSLIDELVTLAGELQRGWPKCWTADGRCELAHEEQLWLDPWRAEHDADFRKEWLAMDWPAQIGGRFGNWLNAQLQKWLLVGEVEQRHWKTELLVDESDEGWARSLHTLRNQQNAPHYMPTRKGAI
jgi:CRISPR-associated protein Csy1